MCGSPFRRTDSRAIEEDVIEPKSWQANSLPSGTSVPGQIDGEEAKDVICLDFTKVLAPCLQEHSSRNGK